MKRLNNLPTSSDKLFNAKIRTLQQNYLDQRRTAARKFNNPRLAKITFTTFRHWKATMEYHKTKDILYVMRLLGHNSLKTTLIYIDLETALFREANDEFTVKVADTLEQASKLLEVGFEYVCDMQGKCIFKKRK
jgi:integrase